MSKKIFTAVLILSLLLFGIIRIGVTSANPVPWSYTPNLEEPTLVIGSPQNYTTYTASNLFLNFSATQPDSWNSLYMGLAVIGKVVSANVSLDGLPFAQYYYFDSAFFTLNQSNPQLNQTSLGIHSLKVTVLSYTYYRGPTYNNTHIVSEITSSSGPVYEYPIVVSDIVYFTVDASTPSPSPSPSLTPSPTPSPTLTVSPIVTPSPSPTQQPTLEPSPTPTTQENSTSIVIIIGILVAVVIVALVVYFKKRRG